MWVANKMNKSRQKFPVDCVDRMPEGIVTTTKEWLYVTLLWAPALCQTAHGWEEEKKAELF